MHAVKDGVEETGKGALRRSFRGLRFAALALGGALLVAAGAAEAPVAEAAQKGDVEAVRSLLRDGADPNGVSNV